MKTIVLTLLLCGVSFAPFGESSLKAAPSRIKRQPFRLKAPYNTLPLNELIRVASNSINDFWATNVPNVLSRQYSPPSAFRRYSTNNLIRTACGNSIPNNASYCPGDHSISYDINFLKKAYYRDGDYAVVTILAHEWGHLVQAHLYPSGSYFSIQMELQADSFAGAYTQYALHAGILEEGDMEEGAINTYNAGDNSPWFAPGAHGTPEQRLQAFLRGFQYGVRGCFQ